MVADLEERSDGSRNVLWVLLEKGVMEMLEGRLVCTMRKVPRSMMERTSETSKQRERSKSVRSLRGTNLREESELTREVCDFPKVL